MCLECCKLNSSYLTETFNNHTKKEKVIRGHLLVHSLIIFGLKFVEHHIFNVYLLFCFYCSFKLAVFLL